MQTIKRSHTTRSSRLTAMMGCLLVALAFAAQAEAPPQTMSYSGRITGQGGNQINDPRLSRSAFMTWHKMEQRSGAKLTRP